MLICLVANIINSLTAINQYAGFVKNLENCVRFTCLKKYTMKLLNVVSYLNLSMVYYHIWLG